MVSFRILGPIECYRGERRVGLGGPQQLLLLAVLLLHANRAVSTDALIDAIWGQGDATGAGKRLQMAISRLRRALEGASGEPLLRTVPGGYRLAVPPGALDADVFEAQLAQGRQALAGGES